MPKEYKLRDGSATLDRRLDRLVHFDDRSRRFNVMHGITERRPRSYTWKCDYHLDQGRDGACVGFGCTHELLARPAEVQNPDVNSVEYAKMVYKEAQKIDPWPGENYSGTSVLAGVRVIHRIGWIQGYFWSFSLDELIFGVAYRGPAVMGVKWFSGMREADADGFVKVKGIHLGGHCVLCKGVDINKEIFTIHNSWGDGWGIEGDCYISFRDMEKLIKMEGEAVFFTGRRSKLE